MVLVREVFVGWLLLGQQLLGRQLAVGVGLARYCLGCSESWCINLPRWRSTGWAPRPARAGTHW